LQKSAIVIKEPNAAQPLQKLLKVAGYLCVFAFTCMVSLYLFISLSNYSFQLTTKLGQALSSFASSIGFGEWIANQLLYVNVKQLAITFLTFAGLLFVGISILRGQTKFIRFCYRNRYLIALFVLIVSVLFKLNGTSLYKWSDLLHGAEQYRPILGDARNVRSDEWAVWSVFSISQGLAGWPAASQAIAGGNVSTLWISVGGIPAFNIAFLFKPLYWGFLFLGTERGFSFLWTMRSLLLFFVSFELAMRYTKRNPWLSFGAAMLLTFAPYVQWWFSQSVAEVLIFGQGILLCLMAYVDSTSRKRRILLAVLLAYCIGCFVMVAYITWLISTLYVVLAVSIAVLISNRKRLSKADIATLLLPVLLAIGYLAIIALSDKATLAAVQNSVYPGRRLVTIGDVFNKPSFFSGLYSLLLPFTQPQMLNSSELSCFLSFAPAGTILAGYSMFKTKKIDSISVALIAFEIACLYFLLVGVPEVVAKITLLSRCNRMNVALGLADIMLLIRGLSYSNKLPLPLVIGSTIAATIGHILMILYFFQLNKFVVIGLVGLYLVLFFLIFTYPGSKSPSKQILAFVLFCVMLTAGGFVNPIQQGTKCVTETNLVKTLASIKDAKEDVYLVEGYWPITNVPLLAGKTSFNSTQVYPNTEKWEPVDPDGQFEDVYNRFCHVSLDLVETETSFELPYEDYMHVDLSVDDLKTYGIQYLVTTKAYTTLHDCTFTLVGAADEWNVYRITYTNATP